MSGSPARRAGGRARLLVAAVLAAAPAARAETSLCTTIDGLPYTITRPGIYCLKADLATAIGTGSAVTIDADDVVVDLNGHKLGGLSAGPGTQADGIHAKDRRNVTIRNGTVRGFLVGVNLTGNGVAAVVEDLRLDGNRQRGLHVEGVASVVQRNLVVATGGSTALGPSTAIVVGTFGRGAVVAGNLVSGVVPASNGETYGIQLLGDHAIVLDNRVIGARYGIWYDPRVAGGAYRGNLTNSVAVPYSGPGRNEGNNQ